LVERYISPLTPARMPPLNEAMALISPPKGPFVRTH
jgi:hypothetical protein